MLEIQVSLLADPKSRKSCLCSLLPTASLLCVVFFIGSTFISTDYKERLSRWGMVDTAQNTKPNICENQCRPYGSEALPKGIVSNTSNLEMRPLWGSPKKKKSPKSSMNLLAIAVGIKQKENVNKMVKKFPLSDFILMLFHYDGIVDEWSDLEWSDHAIHVSAINQTKWWFAKRFLHPDIVSEYSYIFLWDEDLGVENFHPGRRREVGMKLHWRVGDYCLAVLSSEAVDRCLWLVRHLRKQEEQGEIGEKDVDIGDAIPMNNFPPVEIEKDAVQIVDAVVPFPILCHYISQSFRLYVQIVKDEGLEISQPALDPAKSEVHHQITARGRRSIVHRRIYKSGGGRRCDDNSTAPPCTGWVEMMAPVFSRAAWRCAWYMIQNDLIHAWGVDMQLGYCAQAITFFSQGDRTKNVGVVDSEYIVHQGLPTLGGIEENKTISEAPGHASQTKHLPILGAQASSESHVSNDRYAVRRQSYVELEIFKNRWKKAVKEDECWIDPYQQPSKQSNP
ncbi:hypothetical protein HHK36_027253 [Tetracentron sinense]|uniref:Uncharacterized protein n=1 Tax=Tetracentron sinense TaxID=13715 RepID=A0A835D2V6_TETSI|nr:hypothetical protein HHK36_027253 [Tetracentron sinense]